MSEVVHKVSLSVAHHERKQLCETRCPYRQGKKLTSVQVFTVTKESRHLLIYGVPISCPLENLKDLLTNYGGILIFNDVTSYLRELTLLEEFTKVIHVQFNKLQNARFAKKKVDDLNYFGGILHVCYAPELESVEETLNKLVQRRKDLKSWKNKFSNDTSDVNLKEFTNNDNSKLLVAEQLEFKPSRKLIQDINCSLFWEESYKQKDKLNLKRNQSFSEDSALVYYNSVPNYSSVKRKKTWNSSEVFKNEKIV